MTNPAALNADIRRLCGYIKDDIRIANYLGCSPGLVAWIRKRMPVRTGMGGMRRALVNDPSPGEMKDVFVSQSEDGSRRLLHALVRYARNHHPESDLAMLAI